MHQTRRILLAHQLPNALPGVLEGVTQYVKQAASPWQVLLCATPKDFWAAFQRPFADGAITGVGPRSREIVDRLRHSRIPVVNAVRDVCPQLPSVVSDNEAVGRAGAAYFLQRGFREFAFVGIEMPWSQLRCAGFMKAIREAGACRVQRVDLRLTDFEYISKIRATKFLRQWVRKAPRQVAVMCASDFIGRAMLAGCEAAGAKVPEDVAVLGVDNFALECQLANIPMSSVAQDFVRIGFESAALMDRLIAQPTVRPRTPVCIAPGRIFVRKSTDVFAFEDQEVVAALRMIHERAPAGITMKELLQEVPMSRKWLDHRFKKIVGHTPSEEIRRCRMQRVRDLLTDTDMPLRQIAARGGFSCVQNLVRSFRTAYGSSPQAFRRQAGAVPGKSSAKA